MHHEEANLGYFPKVGIVTVSESRYVKYMRGEGFTDPSGDLAEKILREEGFKNIVRVLIGDKVWMIIHTLDKLVRDGCELVVLIGGTGLSKGDVTAEALNHMLERKLDTYPIIYSLESFDEVGSRVLSSRPVAGFYKDSLIISTPGSSNAVKLILKNVLKTEYIHLLWLNKYTKI